MSYSIIRANNDENMYGTKKVLCDSRDDIKKLPVTYKPGSLAFCINDSSKWILNNKKTWVEIFTKTSGGSGPEILDDLEYATNPDIDALF